MKVSIIVPVYNERATVAELLRRVAAVPLDKEIIVVDDGSTDGSREILAELDIPDMRLLLHDLNTGKGGAVRTGIIHSTGGVIIIQDADLELEPAEIPSLVGPVISGTADVVYGSRILNPNNPSPNTPFYWGGRLTTLACNILYGSRITDEPTCYKVFRADLIKQIGFSGNRFEWEPEITAKLLRRGVHIHEVPITYHPRSSSDGKKLGASDGIQAVWTLLKLRFSQKTMIDQPLGPIQ